MMRLRLTGRSNDSDHRIHSEAKRMQQKMLQQMSYTFRPSNSWPRNDGAGFFFSMVV
jgi:hypothetical protein